MIGPTRSKVDEMLKGCIDKFGGEDQTNCPSQGQAAEIIDFKQNGEQSNRGGANKMNAEIAFSS